MRGRWGFGPVFAYEWLLVSRRWQVYAGRSLFAFALLAGLFVVWESWNVARIREDDFQTLALVGRWFYFALVGMELAMVLMVAPVATAGAICQDRARGGLTHLLVTDLSDAEIVLGKMAARLMPILGLIACTLPVLALGSLLGGVDPDALLGSTLVAVGLAVLGCALAMLFSVQASRTHEALMGVYAVWGVWLLIIPWWRGLSLLGIIPIPSNPALGIIDPFLLTFMPYSASGTVRLGTFVGFLAVCLALSAVSTGLAIGRLRREVLRDDARRQGRLSSLLGRGLSWTSRLPGPALDDNPVLWREWHRRRPTRAARRVWGLYVAVVVLMILLLIGVGVAKGKLNENLAAWLNGLQVCFGLLMICLAASTSLAEERTRGSLDVLLTTPLTTREILWGKWWASFRSLMGIALAAMVLTTAVAVKFGRWEVVVLVPGLVLAYGAFFTSFGLAMAAWNRRLDRAVAMTIALYVAVTVGWFFLLVSMNWLRPAQPVPGFASPFFGTGELTYAAGSMRATPEWPNHIYGALGWIVAYAVLSRSVMFVVTRRFDAWMGRVPDQAAGPPRDRPHAAPTLLSPEELAAVP